MRKGERKVRIDIQIDPACTEPRIVVHTDRMTGEIAALLEKLEARIIYAIFLH